MNNFLHATEPTTGIPVEVQRLYKDAQCGNTEHMENNLKWHADLDAKKPVKMLEQAVDLAVAQNDAKTAVTLTTRLKQEKMGIWERYYHGITLIATATVITVLGVIGKELYGSQRGTFRRNIARRTQEKHAAQGVAAADDVVSPSNPRPSSPQERANAYVHSEQPLPAQVVDFVPGSYENSPLASEASLQDALPRVVSEPTERKR